MVRLAELWLVVPVQHTCMSTRGGIDRPITLKTGVTEVSIAFDSCSRTAHANLVRFTEHVQISLTILGVQRGLVSIVLQSPSGTRSVVLPRRPKDVLGDFVNWPFMSVHFWGEDPAGQWTVLITNDGSPAQLTSWQLIVHGTDSPPVRLSETLRYERLLNVSAQRHLLEAPGQEGNKWLVSERVDSVLKLYTAKIERRSSNASFCHAECAGLCRGSTAFDCLHCRNFELVRNNVDECVKRCPYGTYAPPFSGNDARRVCVPCHEACSDCVGPSEFNCTACVSQSQSAFSQTTGRTYGVRYCELDHRNSWSTTLSGWLHNRSFLIALAISITIFCAILLIVLAFCCTRHSSKFSPCFKRPSSSFRYNALAADELEEDESAKFIQVPQEQHLRITNGKANGKSRSDMFVDKRVFISKDTVLFANGHSELPDLLPHASAGSTASVDPVNSESLKRIGDMFSSRTEI